MTQAQELCEQALSLISAGRHDDARRILAKAQALSPDGETRAEVVSATAWVMGETGDLPGGLRHCRDTLAEHDSATVDLGPVGHAIILGRLAALEVRAGNDDVALPLFGAAAAALGDRPAARGRVLINRAYLYLRRRTLAAAAADLDGAHSSFAEIGDKVEEAKVLHNRGYVDLLAGDLAEALDRMNTARETLQHLSPAHRAICDLDRAEVFEAAGMVGDATATLEQVLATLAGTSEWHTRAEAELLLARILVDDDSGRAADLARSAAQHFREQGSDASAIRADAVAARIRLRFGPFENTTDDTDAMVNQLDALHLTSHATELRLHSALSALESGRIGEAERLSIRTELHPDVPITTRLLNAQLQSAIDRKRDRPAAALVHAAHAMDDFIIWQTHFGNLSLQFATQRVASDVVLQGLNAAWETQNPEHVLAWSERARGTAAAWYPVRAPRDENIVAALAEIRSLRDSDDTGAHRRRTALQEQVRDLGWRGSASAVPHRASPSVAEARTALDTADADLLTYLWLGDRLVAMTVTAVDVALFDLGPWTEIGRELAGLPADLDLAAARHSTRLTASIARSLTRRLATLDRMLLRPLSAALGRQRILLTAPGVLGGVPWGLLPSLSGRSLSVAVSVGWWIGSADTAPTFDVVAVVAGPGTEHGEREAQGVADAWTGRTSSAMGSTATTAMASTLASRAGILHLCAHGGYSREHPLFSSIGLADGPWFGHDIEQLEAVPSLVVISACDMGRAVGELDTLGMARAWLHAGARCVVAAPASVDDERAADLFPAVHRRIADGAAPGDALASVQRGELGVAALCYGNAW